MFCRNDFQTTKETLVDTITNCYINNNNAAMLFKESFRLRNKSISNRYPARQTRQRFARSTAKTLNSTFLFTFEAWEGLNLKATSPIKSKWSISADCKRDQKIVLIERRLANRRTRQPVDFLVALASVYACGRREMIGDRLWPFAWTQRPDLMAIRWTWRPTSINWICRMCPNWSVFSSVLNLVVLKWFKMTERNCGCAQGNGVGWIGWRSLQKAVCVVIMIGTMGHSNQSQTLSICHVFCSNN